MLAVSLVTISQYVRIDFLKILVKCIKNQDYKNIIEWIIVDTSLTGYNKSENNLENFISELKNDSLLPKIIYHKTNKTTIGAWRNEGNKLVSGDIIVCMDDDDYYPPTRVSHAVDALSTKNFLIAGCDKILFYDVHFDKLYYHKGIGKHHSTNNCMAYWKNYLDNHCYDKTVNYAEENSFTNNYTEPLYQLDSILTVIQFSHDNNTYDKKRIIYQNYFLDAKNKYITETDTTIEKIINNDDIYRDYLNIFSTIKKPLECPYDIVYFTGGFSIEWSPKQQNLTGAEQAVKYLSMEWARENKKVVVYGNLLWEGNYEGVEYQNYLKFRFWDKFKILILWRIHGCYPFIKFDLKAEKIFVDVHDHSIELYKLLLENNSKINKWMLKSRFQQCLIENTMNQKIDNCIIIPNGIKINDFSVKIRESRNQFRLCYCSCYTRGLYRILKYIWPIIYKLEPKAELHTYYGMDLVIDNEFKNELKELLSQPGVMDHGRQPVEIINREKHLSTYHLYYTDTISEIDCISIKESLVAGCIPIISNIHLFRERDGIHLEWLPNTPDFNYQIACSIIELMNNDKIQKELETLGYQSKTIISWQQCANTWLQFFN